MAAPAEILAEVRAWSARVDRLLAAGQCPGCGGKIERRGVDPHQGGASAVPGAWVNWRCKDCGYMIDVKESV